MSGAVELEAALRAGLEGVTPGPWRLSQEFHCYWVNGVFSSGGYRVENQKQADNFKSNGEHLARCSPDNILTLLDTIATLRSDNERLGRERDADIDALHGTFSKPIAVLQERVAAAEAERDTLLAQVAEMMGVLTEIAESDDIDNALDPERNKRLARAARTKEPS